MKTPTATPKTFSKILFAVDASAQSAAAADAVAAMAVPFRAEVLVLHVETDGGGFEDGVPAVRDLVEGIAKRLAERGVAATTDIRTAPHGKTAQAIVEAAAESGADLVALGSRGRSELGGLLFGSVSHQVLAGVHCPVLVVRPGRDQQPGAAIKRILLAVAGGDEVPHAVEAAAAVAGGSDAEVLVLHIRYLAVAEAMAWIEPDAQAETLVAEIVSQLRASGVAAQGRVAGPSSFIAHDIASAAADWDADLIVIGSRRVSELVGLLENSVSHGVIHSADRPVLVAEGAGGVEA